MRMVTDLGGHRRIAGRFGPRSNRTLFWWYVPITIVIAKVGLQCMPCSVYLLDRVLSIGTGRPVTFLDTHIDVPEPDIDSQRISPTDPDRPSLAFAYNIRLTKLYGKVAQIVNSSSYWLNGLSNESGLQTRASSPVRGTDDDAGKRGQNSKLNWQAMLLDESFQQELKALADAEDSIISLYESLPSNLAWNVDK